MGLFGSDAAAKEAARARQTEEERQRRVDVGTQHIREMFDNQFNPTYYQTQITDPATKLYTDDRNTQYRDSMRQLQYALARTGTSNSSLRDRRMAEAQRQFDLSSQDIQSRVRGLVNARKGDVANAESMAQQQLLASANPTAASAQAANLIGAQTDQGKFQPLGQVFQDFSAGLATQADLERQGTNRYDFGVSDWGGKIKNWTKNI